MPFAVNGKVNDIVTQAMIGADVRECSAKSRLLTGGGLGLWDQLIVNVRFAE